MSEAQKGKSGDMGDQPKPTETAPGFCSASCVRKECIQEEIKKPDFNVRTSDVFTPCKLPKKFEHAHWFNGYGSQLNRQHPFYRTTSSEYGWHVPGIHSVTSVYFPMGQAFSAHLYETGMYRNYSLNMSAPDPPTKLC